MRGNVSESPAVLTVDEPSVAVAVTATARRRGWPAWLVRIGSVAAFIALWQVLTANHVRLWLRFDTLPTVTEIASAFARRVATEDYWLDLGQSLIRILTGFALAWPAGVWLRSRQSRAREAARA